MSHSVFLSHSSTDAEVATGIVGSLESSGIRCWIAPRDVAAGADFASEIMRGIEASSFLVLLLTKASNVSQHVLREVGRAASRQKRIIVVRVEHIQPSEGLEYLIGGLQWIDAFAHDASKLPDNLRNAITSASSVSEAVTAPQTFAPSPIRTLAQDRSIREIANLSRLGFDAVATVSENMRDGRTIGPTELLDLLKQRHSDLYSALTAGELVRLLKDAVNHGFCPGLEKLAGGFVVHEAHISFKQRTGTDFKSRLARTIAATLNPGMKIGLDGGSTTLAVFEEILALVETDLLQDVTIVTNSMSIIARACAFTAERGYTDATCPLRVYVIGGRLRIITAAVAGVGDNRSSLPPGLQEILNDIGRLDIGIVGANGLTLEGGATIPTPDEIPLKRAILLASEHPFVAADGSKFGVRFEHQLMSWDGVARLLTTAPTTVQGKQAWDMLQQTPARDLIDIV